MPSTMTSAVRTRRIRAVRPGFVSFLIPFAVLVAILVAAPPGGGSGPLAWYTTIVWSLPTVVTLRGLSGGLLTRGRPAAEPPPGPVPHRLIVVIPTIGRCDVLPALERVVASCCEHLPAAFTDVRIDVVVEEGCAARRAITLLAGQYPLVRIVEIPADFRTARGTRFKARANHFANLVRITCGEARDDVWVLHMDDDTGVGEDTAAEVARFVHEQHAAGEAGLHLAQGVLTYPREHARNRWVWLADAVRPGCDVSLFAAGTGRGTPSTGLHGELLLIRASVEAAIGWDFGPSSTVEDAEFALRFSARHPGRSGWFAGRSYGASPATVRDFLRQRERWVSGLLRLVVNRAIPVRHRLPLLHSVAVWLCGPAQHPAVVLALDAVLGGKAAPVTPLVAPLWALNAAFSWWLYWEGYRINVRSSADSRSRFGESARFLVMIPLFVLWEGIGIVRGIAGALRRDPTFTVIAKPL
ncbi:glycosyltransferase family 2 protein [Amycolatopsis sp. NPDC059021]|uniref:glycosyltransferase family 2 protein n=1 Tax=Amycolatopsis sp. NPDC059021 TaxID=3346704 RepID=UPI003670DB31